MILKSVSFEDQMSCTKAKTGPRKCYMQQIENSCSKTSTFLLKKSTCTVEQNKQRLKKQQATLFDILKKKRVALFFFKSKSLVI